MSERYTTLAVAISPAAANERMNDFFTELGELRARHRMPDVHVIVRQSIETPNGESHGLCTIHYGDQVHAHEMVSYAMGHAVGEHQKFALASRSEGMKNGAAIAIKEAKEHHDKLMKNL